MNGQLFAPDIFSRSQPQFESVSSDILSNISEVVETHFTCLGHKLISGEQLIGLEVNSNNFKVRIGPRVYAIKQINKQANIASCNEQLVISQNLLENDIQFPRIIKNDDGNLLSHCDDGESWILAEFIDGDYYSGKSLQFFSIARSLGKMQLALETIGDKKGLPQWASAETWFQTNKFLSELLERKSEWSTLFPASEYELMIREHDSLVKSINQVMDYTPKISYNIVPAHMDIHPHNILVTVENVPVFVDVDSIQLADKIQCLAFATYKLARQHVIYDDIAGSHKHISMETKKFVDILAQEANINRNEVKDFPLAATIEILRRIAIVTNNHINKKYRKPNTILHMQIMALREIPLLFSGL